MIKKVKFVSRITAEKMPGWAEAAIISITEPDSSEANLMQGWHSVHRLVFDDIASQSSDSLILMTDEHADEIVKFVHSVSPNVSTIVVHCKGGISRSAAVAKWIAEVYDLPFVDNYSLYNMHVYHQLLDAAIRKTGGNL